MAKKYSTKKANPAARPHRVARADLPTRYGRFTIYGFQGRDANEEAIALVRGKLNGPFTMPHRRRVGLATMRLSSTT
jgi:hypothetical protein